MYAFSTGRSYTNTSLGLQRLKAFLLMRHNDIKICISVRQRHLAFISDNYDDS